MRPVSLIEMPDRKILSPIESIVSREIDGVWLTGASDLDRDQVIALLKEQGYTKMSGHNGDRTLPTQRIEKFKRN